MAKKSTGFGELLKQKRAEKAHQEGLEKLRKKIQKETFGGKPVRMVASPKGEAKMSDVLEAFANPYLDFAQNHSEREKLFSIAIVAWNIAILPKKDQKPMIDQAIKAGFKENDPLAQQDIREIINELIARKQKFFAKNKRYILDFQLQDTGQTFYLSVVSTLQNPLLADQAD